MGDRGQIQVNGKPGAKGGIYFYTHWGGTEMAQRLAAALDSKQGRGRRGDDSYLNRIVWGFLLAGDDPVAETGLGIDDAMHGDIEHPLLYVDHEKQQVRSYQVAYPDGWDKPAKIVLQGTWTFDDFIKKVTSEVTA